ncbi:hypothetical protein M3Y97_00559100 [Aphelenchoides bicaudatus]|nr:hypothetical protein M3Y97_00559100 [Aphelenchoides bicaudatus]
MLAFVLIACCVLIALLFVRHLRNAGYFDKVEIEVVEKPRFIGQNLEILYKYYIGPYQKTGDYIKELRSLVGKDAKIISVYYDNPKLVREELCQSIVGVIYSIDDNAQLEPHFATNLSRWGFERFRMPAVNTAVSCQQRFSGFFSYLHLIWHVYPQITKFFEEQRFECRLTVEILTGDRLKILCPLDHVEEFVVSEVLSTEKLEEKLASGEFQLSSDDNTDVSDEESSDFDEQTEDENTQLLDA